MKVQLTLSEKIRDMRDERKLKLQDVADATGISLATLGRIESNDDSIVSYQNVAKLAQFYDVSTDYLCCVAENRQHRNVEIDALSPEHNETIEEMKDFVQSYVEDRKTQPEAVAKFHKLCKQLQLNSKSLSEEEQRVMMKALERSPHLKRGGKRRK